MTDTAFVPRVGGIILSRPAGYDRLVEERRQRERIRKREARRRQTPQQRERDRFRKQKARKRQTSEQREREKARERSRDRKKIRPFMAIDGEGGGTDALDRQNYLLMVASGTMAGEEHVLHRGGKALLTKDCLEFLLRLPAEPILVGYGFGYDATQILRGIKPQTLKRILNPPQTKNGPGYTYWGDYGIIYQQGQYFRVARVDRSGTKPAIKKGSSRTVHENLGFFQCAFVKAIKDWNIGDEEERVIIAENKSQREEFSQLTEGIVQYCKLECRYLAMLMTEFREVCTAAGISPRQWSGSGWLAAALLDKHGVPKRPLTAKEVAALAECAALLRPGERQAGSNRRRRGRSRRYYNNREER
jgi:hypothetical protein